MRALHDTTTEGQAARVQRLLVIASDALGAAASVRADPPGPEPACCTRYVEALEATRRKVEALRARATGE